MRAPFRSVLLAVAALALATVPVHAHPACASNHIAARLDGFSDGSVSLPLYWATESDGQATVTLRILDSSCDGSASSVNWAVQPDSPMDYSPATTPFQWVNSVGHPPTQQRQVTITNDAFAVPVDAGVEAAKVVLTGGSNVRFEQPSSAALIIVDDDGPSARVSLVEGEYSENESSPSGGVPVFRGGNASGSTQVSYTVAGGSAQSGADYQASASGTLEFGAGSRMQLIPITVVDDTQQESTETVNVSISGADVDPAGTSSVTFSIADNEEVFPPSSRLHHPRQKYRYRASDFRIREVHIFTEDTGGAGVVASEFALRRNMKNGDCSWWSGRKFKKSGCDKERWLKTGQYEPDFFYIRVKELDPSVGPIDDYTAYSRAIDGAKNLETSFEVGRNENTFEVKKPKR
jgi:hypothetical protein